MKRRRDPSPPWKRLEVVMRVQLGQMTVREAARALGISPKHFYRLEAKVMAAALSAVTPGKRGRKARQVDPKIAELSEKLQKSEREKELLQIRARDLEEVNEAMKTRVLDPEPGGKKRGKRPTLSSRVPGDGAGASH